MSRKYFKDYSDEELTVIFNKEKSVQEDIKGMMELGMSEDDLTEAEISKEIKDNAIGYFIDECRYGVYVHSYYDEEGNIRYDS